MDAYQQVTDAIIAELENGSAPWVKPWRADASSDRNLVSGKGYRGINRVLLGMSSMSQGFTSSIWATYKQWQEKGAQVQKGQKGTHIVFFKPVAGTKDAATGETSDGYCVIRGYVVFNASQTDYVSTEPAAPAFDPVPVCEQFMVATGAVIGHGGDRAFYSPSTDRVQMPNKTAFVTPANYYATAFHELTHWTSHKSRCDRDLSQGRFGNPEYAFEELVAELGAAFLCSDMGIDGDIRHAAYIGSWLKALRNDKKAIFKAAALAQKAADYLNQSEVEEQAEAA